MLQTKAVKEGDPNLAGDHIREGLAAVLAVRVPSPEFEGQTKTRLGNPEVRKLVDGVVAAVRARPASHSLLALASKSNSTCLWSSILCHHCLCTCAPCRKRSWCDVLHMMLPAQCLWQLQSFYCFHATSFTNAAQVQRNTGVEQVWLSKVTAQTL